MRGRSLHCSDQNPGLASGADATTGRYGASLTGGVSLPPGPVLRERNIPLPVVVELPGFDVLTFAATQGRILLSHNRRHFLQLHRHRMENHAGIVLCTVDSDFGGQAQRIHAAVANVSDMRNQLIRVTHLRRGQRFVELFFLSLDGFGGGFDEFADPVGPGPEERGGGTEASGDEANIAGVDVFGGDRGGSE